MGRAKGKMPSRSLTKATSTSSKQPTFKAPSQRALTTRSKLKAATEEFVASSSPGWKAASAEMFKVPISPNTHRRFTGRSSVYHKADTKATMLRSPPHTRARQMSVSRAATSPALTRAGRASVYQKPEAPSKKATPTAKQPASRSEKPPAPNDAKPSLSAKKSKSPVKRSKKLVKKGECLTALKGPNPKKRASPRPDRGNSTPMPSVKYSPCITLMKSPLLSGKYMRVKIANEGSAKKIYPKTPVGEMLPRFKSSPKIPVFSTPTGVHETTKAAMQKAMSKTPTFDTPTSSVIPARKAAVIATHRLLIHLAPRKKSPSKISKTLSKNKVTHVVAGKQGTPASKFKNTGKRASHLATEESDTPVSKVRKSGKTTSHLATEESNTPVSKAKRTASHLVTGETSTPKSKVRKAPRKSTSHLATGESDTPVSKVKKTTGRTTSHGATRETGTPVTPVFKVRKTSSIVKASAGESPLQRDDATKKPEQISKTAMKTTASKRVQNKVKVTKNSQANKKTPIPKGKVPLKQEAGDVMAGTPAKAAKVLGKKVLITKVKRKVTPGRKPMGDVDLLTPDKQYISYTDVLSDSQLEEERIKFQQIEKETPGYWGWCTIL